ncbi:MAG: phospholipase [Bacteroidia bacterium]|nr:MAG: phospholipase [Bacteroidia bacterium]
MHEKKVIYAGKRLAEAGKAIILIHGRGGTAENILSLTEHLELDEFAILAPQATRNTWYPYSFLVPRQQNQPWLNAALGLIGELVNDIMLTGITKENIFISGFSQGACLSLEFAARNPGRYGGIIAFTGGLIGDKITPDQYNGDFLQTPVFIGTSDPDPHIPVERAKQSEQILRNMHAKTTLKIYKDLGHMISLEQLDTVNTLFFAS